MRSFQSARELCSFGQFGLIDAIEQFEPPAGSQFATYATTGIQRALIDELRRDDILPTRMRARVRSYDHAGPRRRERRLLRDRRAARRLGLFGTSGRGVDPARTYRQVAEDFRPHREGHIDFEA
jgi:hypothetical protein